MEEVSPTVYETERLYAREFALEDEVVMADILGEPEDRPFAAGLPGGAEGAAAYVGSCLAHMIELPRRVYELAVCMKGQTEPIGAVRLALDEDPAQGELGYIIKKELRGCGYAQEAAAGMLRFAFLGQDLHRVYAKCDEKNEASAHVLERIGMRREGCSKYSLRVMIRGVVCWRSVYHYAMLSKEYLNGLPDGVFSPTGKNGVE